MFKSCDRLLLKQQFKYKHTRTESSCCSLFFWLKSSSGLVYFLSCLDREPRGFNQREWYFTHMPRRHRHNLSMSVDICFLCFISFFRLDSTYCPLYFLDMNIGIKRFKFIRNYSYLKITSETFPTIAKEKHQTGYNSKHKTSSLSLIILFLLHVLIFLLFSFNSFFHFVGVKKKRSALFIPYFIFFAVFYQVLFVVME